MQQPSVVVGAYEVDSSEPGVMFVRWKRQATEAESQALMEQIAGYWERRERYAAAIETHPAVNADARHRTLWGKWHEQNRKDIETYCVGMAITLDSAVVRGLMTALSWFAKDPYPVKYVADAAAARAWARERIAQSNIASQPSV
jgi:hypothetical protein